MDCHCFDWETWVSKDKFCKVFTQPGISRIVGEGGGVILWRSVDNQWDCYSLHLLMLSVFAAAMLEYNSMLHTECKENVVLKNFGFY